MIKRAMELPYLVIVGALVTAVLGVTAYRELPADLLPTFTTPAVQIVTFYPGMPPEVMERDLTSRLERWTGQSVGIEHQEARSMLGVSVVKDFFREGISFDTAMSQVTSYAVSDMFYLPPGTIPPMVMPFDPTASVPLCLVSVSSPTMTEKELYDVAYFELRNRLRSIPGVIAPAVYGGKLRRILAYVDREKLQARGLAPMDVVRARHEQSVFVPAGNMKAGQTDYQIFANAMPAKVDELNDVPVTLNDGRVVFMRDVASVQDSAQIQSNIVRINGRRQVYIPIYRQPGANTIEIVDAIRGQLGQIRARLREMDARAKDLALEVVLDQSVYVRDSIGALRVAAILGAPGLDLEATVDARGNESFAIGGEYAGRGYMLTATGEVETMRSAFAQFARGLVLAAILVYLVMVAQFRSFADPLMVLVAVPLGFIGVALVLFVSGTSVNIQSVMGMIMMVGIVVEYGIILIHFANARVEQGQSADAAVREAAAVRLRPILMTSLTTVLALLPMAAGVGGAQANMPLARSIIGGVLSATVLTLFVLPCVYVISKRTPASQAGDAPLPASPEPEPSRA